MLLSTYHLEVYSPMGQMWAWSLQWVQGQRTCRSGNCSHYGHNCGVNVKCPHELLCFRTLVSKQSLAGVTIWENCKVLGIESSLKWVARGWLWTSPISFSLISDSYMWLDAFYFYHLVFPTLMDCTLGPTLDVTGTIQDVAQFKEIQSTSLGRPGIEPRAVCWHLRPGSEQKGARRRTMSEHSRLAWPTSSSQNLKDSTTSPSVHKVFYGRYFTSRPKYKICLCIPG